MSASVGERSTYPIDLLFDIAPPAEVAIQGRVVQERDDTRLVDDLTGRVWVESSSPPPLGSWVECQGRWNGKHLERGAFVVVNRPMAPFPVHDGEWAWFHGDQSRRLRLLRRRAAILRAIRGFFDPRGFLEVETPVLVPGPSLDFHIDCFEVLTGKTGYRRFLSSSPEYQMKRLLAGGCRSIYQLTRCFRRAEEGPQHQPEFTMLEWYRAFAGADEVMADTEALVAHVARSVHHGSTWIPAGPDPVNVEPPWERLTVDQAFRKYAGAKVDRILPNEELFYRTLVDQVQPQLGQERPTLLTHWPASMASLARLDPSNPKRAERFEAYVAGVELCNGYTELVDPMEQRARFEGDLARRREEGQPELPIDVRFQAAVEEGLPPAGGNALGVDRLVMLVLGVRDIEDVVAFPNHRL